MNTASGLESANTSLRTTILISREAVPPSMAGDFRAMGRIVLRGRSTIVEVFEAEFDFPQGARERLNAAYARFDAGEVAALGEIRALAAEFPEDAALRRLLERLESVGPGGVFQLQRSPTAAAPTAKNEPLLAVLAFDDLCDGADMGWFSDGVSEEILQTVASRAPLKVIGRGSSFQFRGADKAASKVASALKVTHVLDGSVRRSGSTVRIAAHLIECASETTLWSDRFDRDLSDVFALQDEIAVAVAAALEVVLAPPPTAEAVDPAAYDLFLQARQKASGFSDPAAVAAAIEMLEQATELAPRFARAWTLLAQALMGQFRYHGSDKPYEMMRAKVVKAAGTALGIDPGLGSAYVALSGLEPIGLYSKREALFNKALSVAPNDPEVISTVGWFTASLGRLRETLGYAKQAFDLDPMYTTAANNYAIALTGVGRYSESRGLWAKFCAAWPDVTVFLTNAIGDACFHADWERFDDLVRVARERGVYAGALRDLVRLGDNLRQPDPGYRNGLLQFARQELARTHNVVDRTLVALYRFGLKDETFELIDQAAFDYVVDPEKPWLSAFSVGRLLSMALNESMIRDPRFPRLCDRLGLCDYWVSSERWPDCADDGVLPYDFKAEAHRLAAGP
jgi:adenylate cyclase